PDPSGAARESAYADGREGAIEARDELILRIGPLREIAASRRDGFEAPRIGGDQLLKLFAPVLRGCATHVDSGSVHNSPVNRRGGGQHWHSKLPKQDQLVLRLPPPQGI